MVSVVLVSCSRPVMNGKPSATPAASTPIPASPQQITKQTNVSFSTYSRDWPVGWQWIDPDEARAPTPHNVRSGVLSITIPKGRDLAGDRRNAPRYLKAISGGFQIETRLTALPRSNFQAAGLLIYWNDAHYIRFERSFAGPDGGEGLRLRVRDADALQTVSEADVPTDMTQVDLKVVRRDGSVTAYWRPGDGSEWREVGEAVAAYPETVLAGIAAYNTAEPFDVEFAYIRLLPVK